MTEANEYDGRNEEAYIQALEDTYKELLAKTNKELLEEIKNLQKILQFVQKEDLYYIAEGTPEEPWTEIKSFDYIAEAFQIWITTREDYETIESKEELIEEVLKLRGIMTLIQSRDLYYILDMIQETPWKKYKTRKFDLAREAKERFGVTLQKWPYERINIMIKAPAPGIGFEGYQLKTEDELREELRKWRRIIETVQNEPLYYKGVDYDYDEEAHDAITAFRCLDEAYVYNGLEIREDYEKIETKEELIEEIIKMLRIIELIYSRDLHYFVGVSGTDLDGYPEFETEEFDLPQDAKEKFGITLRKSPYRKTNPWG